MLDSFARRLIDPPLNNAGKRIAAHGYSADSVTALGIGLGLLSALLIALGLSYLALIPLLASRVADGLDGAVARASKPTDVGGYFDIVADFLFYGAVPAAFVFADPSANGAAGAFLLVSFYFNGASFLGFAILAERRGEVSTAQGQKSLYYSNGLLEGTETIAFFVLLCILPHYFTPLAYGFGALSFVTALLRIIAAKQRYPN